MKKSLETLALFGGGQLFTRIRPTSQLALPDPDIFFTYARSAFDHRKLTNNGPLVSRLEVRLAEIHGAKHCIAYCNASIAISAALRLLGGDEGGNVLLPGFGFRGLPHMVQWAGFLPRFCDADLTTHTISPDSVSKSIDGNTRAILAAHHVNSPCLIKELERISISRRIPVLFDSVYGLLQTYNGRPVGCFGAAEVFSLHATKLVNGFEGGYATTNNNDLAEQLRLARSFGFQDKDTVVSLGINGKLNEIHAAMALAALDSLPETLAGNAERHAAYKRFFQDIPGIALVDFAPGEGHNYELVLLEVREEWPLTRDDTVRLLCAENALARTYYSPPLHRSEHCPAGCDDVSLPVAEYLSQRFIQMPVGDLVSVEDIEILAQFMRFLAENGTSVAKLLADGRGAA